jgi:hypothetical protein
MKRVFLFAVFSAGLIAQDNQVQYLNLNKPHYTIGNKVRVRVEADTNAAVVAELPIATELVPIRQTDQMMTQNGIEAPWYEVTLKRDGKKLQGFVWGNLIAKASAKSKGGLTFLFGPAAGKKSDGYTAYTSQVRVAKAGKELAKVEINEGVGFLSKEEVKVTDGRGLTGVENIFTAKYIQEYCAGKNNTIFIFWTGEKLVFAHSTIDGADAPYYASEEQVFPADKGGVKDHIVVRTEHGDHDDPKSVKKEKYLLKWNGTKLEKKK